MKRIVILILLCSTALLQAQSNLHLIKGLALEAGNKAPMPYASISLLHSITQTTADDKGLFRLAITDADLNDSLQISFIGFERKRVAVRDLLKSEGADNVPVMVKRTTVNLPEVTVHPDRSAAEVLQACINSAELNYNENLFAQHGFYRQLHKENGRYCRLIEADVNVAFKSILTRGDVESAEMFRIDHLRRSEVTEANGSLHGDHISDLFKENVLRYPTHSFFTNENLEFFNIAFDSLSLNSDSLYYVKLKSKNLTNKKNQYIYLTINKYDFALTKIVIQQTPSPYYDKTKAGDLSNWDFQNGRIEIRFKKNVDHFYYLQSIEQYYNHFITDPATNHVKYIVEESFSFWTDGSEPDMNVSRDPAYKAFGDLYLKPYVYDAAFWLGYAPLKAHPLEAAAQADLEKNKKLDIQFAAEGK